MKDEARAFARKFIVFNGPHTMDLDGDFAANIAI